MGERRATGDRRTGPIRTCVGCRLTDEQRALVRVVADAAGRVRIDVLRRRPGRGAYVHRNRECISEVVRRGALARSLKRKLETLSEETLWSRIELAVDEKQVFSGAEKES